MRKNEGIFEFKDFGKVIIDLKPIMKKEKITKTQLYRRTGLHHQVIDRYMSGNLVRFDGEILAKLCFVLNCELIDIVKYIRPR